jgi:DNA-binding NtrC family response regulator
MPRGDSDLAGLKVVTFHDFQGGQDSMVATASSGSFGIDVPLLDAARRVFRPSAVAGSSLQTVSAREALQRAGLGAAPAIFQGEAGSGKTFYARCLHFSSDRCGPFLHLEAASVSADSLETELFGDGDSMGIAEAADKGTLYISGLERLSISTQERLVQLVERGELAREGAKKAKRVHVRLLASTRENLRKLEEERRITSEFLALFDQNRIEIAPLSERLEDVPSLAQELAHNFTGGGVQLTESDLWALEKYGWPGNVRELEDCVEVLCAAALGDESGLGSLPECLRNREGQVARKEMPLAGTLDHVELRPAPRLAGSGNVSMGMGGNQALGESGEPVSLDLYEKLALERALQEVGGDKLAAAKLLNVGKSTLYRKLKRHGIA